MSTATTFAFGESDGEHLVGDRECDACWHTPISDHGCDAPGCLKHNSFIDESNDDVLLTYLGDLCRED